MSLNVVCVNAGNYEGRGAEYVRVLNDMVRRNLPAGYPGRFIVFTDDPSDYGPEIERRDLPCTWLDGWWHKLSLFKQGVFEEGERVLYFDLDTLITGRLDAVAAYRTDFAILRDAYRPAGLQSAVMKWTVSPTTERIWSKWIEAGSPHLPGGDQAWLEMVLRKPDILQDELPDTFVSFKGSHGEPPAKASVVFFHGIPRPHQVTTGWVPEVWKEGGMTRAELDAVCNTDLEKVHANIRSAIARPLPWFDLDYTPHERHAVIVGGGPSLKDCHSILNRRVGWGQEIWALNGAFDYLVSQDILPDVHVILDARPENAGFVTQPHVGVRYLISSQCDPAVFDALEGYDVTVFHCASEGVDKLVLKDGTNRPIHLLGAGTTVAMKAAVMAELTGYRTLHLIGVDSCYFADEHHSYAQSWNEGETIMDVVYGERTFKCAPWMVGQAEDFIDLARRFDGIITIEGDGLLAHIAREGVAEPDYQVRAREILSRLPEKPLEGAEIGIFAGELSGALLNARPEIRLHMVDSWGDYEQSFLDSDAYHGGLSQETQEAYYRKTVATVSRFNGRAIIHRAKSLDVAEEIVAPLDFVFIDADHSYEGCSADIEAWSKKVRPGGLLCGHDYDNTEFPQWGVKRAVDEYVAANGLKLDLGDNFTWFVRTEGEMR